MCVFVIVIGMAGGPVDSVYLQLSENIWFDRLTVQWSYDYIKGCRGDLDFWHGRVDRVDGERWMGGRESKEFKEVLQLDFYKVVALENTQWRKVNFVIVAGCHPISYKVVTTLYSRMGIVCSE